ncbi:MAG: ABC transporter ATP-binding protein/permease [Oscillospiraceae bacterium]|nr:ABC transporter ATP-binding protein/permease [Oscillospiraceae bacterium]
MRYHISMIKRGLLTLMQMDKGYIVLYLIIEAMSPFTPYLNIYMSARIIDELLGSRNVNTLILYVLIVIGGNMILSLVVSGLTHLRNYHENQFYKGRSMILSEKNMSMDYENMENSDVRILLERIKVETQTGHNVFYLFTRAGNFIRETINIILAAALTFGLFANPSVSVSLKLIILVMVAVVITVNYISVKKRSRIYLKMYDSYAPMNGFFNFYARFFSDYNAGKDTRLYAMEDFIEKDQNRFFTSSHNIGVSTVKKIAKYMLFNTIITDALRISTYIFVILASIAGSVTIGSITMYVSCIIRVIGSFSTIVVSAQELIQNNNYLARYFKFLDIPSKMHKGTIPVEKRRDNQYEIEFKNVSFKYPGSETYAVKNLNMKLNIGQRMAVVGMNGSGKTTMIKLLCRLYDPTEGEITLNGFDIKKYDYDEYMSIFGVVFQDFKLFSFTLGQNVATSENIDEAKASKCLSMAGFDERLETMPKGLATSLYRDFDEVGVEISGGEAQKIALARALYKDAPFIVLDEPTAALDPVAEFEIYSKFNEVVGEKTAIYISHRLSSCRFCDDIAVFHEGKLIQRGSHDMLIADEGGKYHELWNAQAQYYQENNDNLKM